jgi:hypothetical protein
VSIAVLDTYAFVKRLTAAGMPEAQAEVLADEQVRLIDDRLASKTDLALLATKADLSALAAATKADMAALAAATKDDVADVRKEMGAFRLQSKEDFARLEVKIEATRSEILRWMFGQTLLILGAVLAIGRFWH